MQELGYVEGGNVQYEWRFTEGKSEPLAAHAAELVRLKVDVIVSGGTPASRAALDATRVIPIVMVYTGDPVGSGLVASLARPGGNVTGITNINVEMNAKRVDLLAKILPRLSRVAALLNPANPTYAANRTAMQEAARTAKHTLLVFDARTAEEVEHAFSMMAAQQVEALIVHTDSFFFQHARLIGELIAKARLPAIVPRAVLDFGGLATYEPNMRSAFLRASAYVDRILKGAKPADLAVEQPTKLDLALNARTAKALGISLPSELMLVADEVIR
jgi:putative ABC transport system substrate-binding protein